MINYKEQYEKFQEENPTLQRCTDKKLKNPKFSDYISPFISKDMLYLIKDCGNFLAFVGDVEMEHKKLHKGSFCKNRFCPMCAWRRASKDSMELSILVEHLRKEEGKDFIFLTLTTPNVKGDKLNEAILDYNKAFKKLMERKEVKQIVKGYIRKLEVTYQKEKYITKELWKRKKAYYKNKGLEVGDLEPNYDTYNPHFHVVIAVNSSYFTDKNYIKRERWLELWELATGDKTITQVDVKKAKIGTCKEIYELAKYSAKDSDYLVSRPIFETFYNALKGKQTMVFGGLFKEAHKLYQQKKLDYYKEKDEIQYVYMIYYNWYKSEYENSRIRELTEDEKKQINGKLIEEIEIN